MTTLGALLAALGLLFKATMLIGVGLLAARLMRKSGADARHALWTATVCGLLVLPLFGALLPEWRAPLPTVLSGLSAPGGVLGSPAGPRSMTSSSSRPEVAGTTTLRTGEAAATKQTPSSSFEIVAGALLVVWAGGTLVVLGLLGRSHLEMRRTVRVAHEPREGTWTTETALAAAATGVRRTVRLLEDPKTLVPITWGVGRPVILLPNRTESWSASRRRAVLLHEFAHIARFDCAIEYAAWLACAVYWFHPGVWYVARRLRAERERACDDRVVAAGTSPAEYATHLVDVAAGITAPRRLALAALAMTTRGGLESRLIDLLDPTRSRARLGTGLRLTIAASTLAGVAAAATVQPGSAAAAQVSGPRPLGPTWLRLRDTTQQAILPNDTVHLRGSVVAGDTVSVRAAMGTIVVDTASGSEVRVTATRRAGPRGMTATTRVGIMGVPGGMAICSMHIVRQGSTPERPVAPCEVNDDWGRGSVDDNEVDFHVLVPPGVHLKLMTGLGDLRALAVGASISALTGNGWAEIASDGAATIEAFSGRVGYTMLPSASTAPVVLRVKHGDIDIRFDPGASASYEISPGRGSVRSALPGTRPLTVDRSVSGRVGDGRRSLAASLEKGDISLRLSPP
jgi:beta-lactamase regulating signal transducer with metallopeptidase domain